MVPTYTERMPQDWLQALLDPTAPLPNGWPIGALGAFLLFLLPIGSGIPGGVLMAHASGIPPVVTTLLYFLSDIVLAFTAEPLIVGGRWLGRHVRGFARLGSLLERVIGGAGLKDRGVRGPVGLIGLAFIVSPTTARVAAAAAGHGMIPGWALAIAGDMSYFLLLLVMTLVLSSVVDDARLTIGIVFGVMFLLPLLWRRKKQQAQVAVADGGPLP